MRKSKRLVSTPVISLEEGRQIGAVKGLVIDPAGKRVAALVIEQKGWFKEQRFIPYHKVHSVGGDAITIEKTSGVERASGLPEIVKLSKEKVGLIGARIVAENGTALGYVDEYYIDLATGTIAGLEFSGNLVNSVLKGRTFLDIAHVRTLGKEVVIIANDGLDNIFKLEGGLQESVKNVRESTGHLWESTVQKTRELGASLNKSLEKVRKDKKPGASPGDKDNSPAETAAGKKDPENPAPAEPPVVVEQRDGMGGQDQPAAKGGREEAVPQVVPLPPGSNGEARKDIPPA